MDFLIAFGQGFSSFFSIWQVCILQISPFFMAYIIALYFADFKEQGDGNFGGRVLLPALTFAPGFAIFYALLSLNSLPVGRILSYNLGYLGFSSGVYILLVTFTLLLSGRMAFADDILKRPVILAVGSFVLGASFALVYSPCITPALSEILSMTSRAETAVRGGVLALFYSMGICLGLTVTASAIVLVLKRSAFAVRKAGSIKDVGSLGIGILGILNVTGLMVYYKAFFLGLLVP